jgi:hypothetical protein
VFRSRKIVAFYAVPELFLDASDRAAAPIAALVLRSAVGAPAPRAKTFAVCALYRPIGSRA